MKKFSMDRFEWLQSGYQNNEEKLSEIGNVRIYDGDEKTGYDSGILILTTHKLVWRESKNAQISIALQNSFIVFSETQSGGIGKSPKVCLHLNNIQGNKAPGPVARSQHNFIKFAFKSAGEVEFNRQLKIALEKKSWIPANKSLAPKPKTGRASGIVGIERKLEENKRKTDNTISVAFQDLTQLIEKAKEMVVLSSNIASKIKDKKGDITDDETVKFKSYLLSLGIANPVTKETHGSGTHYHMQLAHEIASLLSKPIEENGGIMLLSDAYCRINRARGLELLSPEDLLTACKIMSKLNLEIVLREFDTGVIVLQSKSHNDDVVIEQTTRNVEENSSLSAQELGNFIDMSVLLAKERLLLAEKGGGVCRDDSDEGLRFYPNLFLTKI